MDDELICNFKKCRKRLNATAWVTSCSHIFCEEDGSREFGKQSVCPACETTLSGKFDIVKVDLQPTEQYKSMVLAGLRPEVIMEICSRALSFWTYQAHQERAYQEYCATKAVERAQQQESYYEQAMTVTQSETTSLKSNVAALKKDLESLKTKYNEVSDKLLEKSRQYQKLQGMYETLRRRTVSPALFGGSEPGSTPRHHFNQQHHGMQLGTLHEREVNLPQLMHRRQAAGFSLQPGMSSGTHMASLTDNLAISSAVAAVSHSQSSLHLNPSLQVHPNPQEEFTIKLAHPIARHETTNK